LFLTGAGEIADALSVTIIPRGDPTQAVSMCQAWAGGQRARGRLSRRSRPRRSRPASARAIPGRPIISFVIWRARPILERLSLRWDAPQHVYWRP